MVSQREAREEVTPSPLCKHLSERGVYRVAKEARHICLASFCLFPVIRGSFMERNPQEKGDKSLLRHSVASNLESP